MQEAANHREVVSNFNFHVQTHDILMKIRRGIMSLKYMKRRSRIPAKKGKKLEHRWIR
jgi:hypothetical protein